MLKCNQCSIEILKMFCIKSSNSDVFHTYSTPQFTGLTARAPGHVRLGPAPAPARPRPGPWPQRRPGWRVSWRQSPTCAWRTAVTTMTTK